MNIFLQRARISNSRRSYRASGRMHRVLALDGERRQGLRYVEESRLTRHRAPRRGCGSPLPLPAAEARRAGRASSAAEGGRSKRAARHRARVQAWQAGAIERRRRCWTAESSRPSAPVSDRPAASRSCRRRLPRQCARRSFERTEVGEQVVVLARRHDRQTTGSERQRSRAGVGTSRRQALRQPRAPAAGREDGASRRGGLGRLRAAQERFVGTRRMSGAGSRSAR